MSENNSRGRSPGQYNFNLEEDEDFMNWTNIWGTGLTPSPPRPGASPGRGDTVMGGQAPSSGPGRQSSRYTQAQRLQPLGYGQEVAQQGFGHAMQTQWNTSSAITAPVYAIPASTN
jgi:hypothetical protein